MPATKRPWKIHKADPVAAAELARAGPFHPVVAQLLLNRGQGNPRDASLWLSASAPVVLGPDAVPGALAAGERLNAAVRGGERICIYGDYDVDGCTGSAILLRTLRSLGGDARSYVPHRLEEGYGVNAAAVRRIATAGFNTLVTVDCGVASPAEATLARSLGLDVIVTDHHQPKAEGPPTDALVVHPGLPGRMSENPNLCGSGVAFKVALATLLAAGAPFASDLVDDCQALAALGTVADVVPLVGENRALVRHGLRSLALSEHAGLRSALVASGLKEGKVLAEDVGFRVAPRFNAAGRLGFAGAVVKLLTEPGTDEEAMQLGLYLDHLNRQRQQIERRITAEAREQGEQQAAAERPVIIASSDAWHPGVIGIVASRLVERFQRPALVVTFATTSGVGYGSGRSIPGMNLHEMLQEATAHLVSHGGHAAAAGFKVRRDNLDDFTNAIWGKAAGLYGGPPPPPPLVLEAEADVRHLSVAFVRALERFEPHGSGNPRPMFYFRNCRVEDRRMIGQDQTHLSFKITQAADIRQRVRCIAFGAADRFAELGEYFVDLAAVPKINEWQGRQSVELEIQDFRPSQPGR